jgi:hypothetical protein
MSTYYLANLDEIANAKTLTIKPDCPTEQWKILNVYYSNTVDLVRVGANGERATFYTGTVAGAQTNTNFIVTYYDYLEMVNKTTVTTYLGYDGEGRK